MNLENLSKNELEDKFQIFLFNLSEQQEDFIKKARQNDFELDYSLESLPVLEEYLVKKNITVNEDEYNDAAAYLGEVVRRNIGGEWQCSLDKDKNSLYYGLPVIYGHSKFDIELSPFSVVRIFLLRHRENHFLKVINNHINPELKDITF